MKKPIELVSLSLMFLTALINGCAPAPASTPATPVLTMTTSPTDPPTPTSIPVPTVTITPSIQELEIVEWSEYPYANLADPQNKDTRLEILVHNPNDFPIRLNLDEVELKLLNEAGEIVYTNVNPTFFIWEGSWMLGGETAAISACLCFETDGVARQDWTTVELVTQLEEMDDIAYTPDVEVTIGEFFSLSEAHLGGDQLGTEITLNNTSGQALKSFEVRVTARDANDKYVGVATYGSFSDHDDSGNYIRIEPGASANGIVVSLIDYVEKPLSYEVSAIGILADQ
jgi:hypothetical protein